MSFFQMTERDIFKSMGLGTPDKSSADVDFIESSPEAPAPSAKPTGSGYRQYFDSSIQKMVRLYDDCKVVAAIMTPGPSGFALAQFEGNAPFETECPNLVLSAASKSSALKRPAKHVPAKKKLRVESSEAEDDGVAGEDCEDSEESDRGEGSEEDAADAQAIVLKRPACRKPPVASLPLPEPVVAKEQAPRQVPAQANVVCVSVCFDVQHAPTQTTIEVAPFSAYRIGRAYSGNVRAYIQGKDGLGIWRLLAEVTQAKCKGFLELIRALLEQRIHNNYDRNMAQISMKSMIESADYN